MGKITSNTFLAELVKLEDISNMKVHVAFVKFMKAGGSEPLPTFKKKFISAQAGDLPVAEEVVVVEAPVEIPVIDEVTEEAEVTEEEEEVQEEEEVIAPAPVIEVSNGKGTVEIPVISSKEEPAVKEEEVEKEVEEVVEEEEEEEEVVEEVEETVEEEEVVEEEITEDDIEIEEPFEDPVEELVPNTIKLDSSNVELVKVKPTPAISSNVGVRSTKNYKNGDEVPDMPGLIPTGTKFDELISDRITSQEELDDYKEKYGEDMPEDMVEIGGFTRKCADIRAARAGAGKTWTTCMLAAKAKIFARKEFGKDIRVGLISAEMRESEWAKELKGSPILEELEVDYMLDYVGCDNYQEIFWEAFGDYDIVVVDSFPAVISHFRMVPAEKRTEKALVFDFIRTSLISVANNDNNAQIINQATKDGNYKGGTELPHMMSSLSFINVDEQERYMEFNKNRNNGGIGKKLYTIKTKDGDLDFKSELYDATYKKTEDKKQSISDLISKLKSGEDSIDGLGEDEVGINNIHESGNGGETEEEIAELG